MTPRPAWQDLDTYRAAMLSTAADDITLLEQPTLYHIVARLYLDGDQPHLHVVQDTRYTNRTGQPLDWLYFRVWPNKPSYGSQMTFSQIRVAGREPALDDQADNTALGLAQSPALPAGESVDVHMEYDVSVPQENGQGYGTYNFQDGVMLLSNFFAMVAVHDANGWNLSVAPDYGDPIYAETSLFDIEFTAPAAMTVIASGSTREKHENADGTQTWTLVTGPMRDCMVVVSDQLQVSSTAVGYLRVNSYYRADQKAVGEQALGYARDALRAYQQSFGPYPFAELDVVEAPITAGGMEYPGVVLLAQQYYEQGGEYFEFVTAHEVAHQWWYSLVGDDQVNTPWLDESLANFSTVYYYESTYDRDRADLAFKNYVASRYEAALNKKHDAPVNKPVAEYTPEDYGYIVYGKGAVFFSELRKVLGDDGM
jgi:aminopeptidase N